MTDELRVPKRRVQAEVLLPGGATRQATFFLSEFAPHHNGPERLSDLLNAQDDFVPAVDAATESMIFINRHIVAAARVAGEWEPGDELPGAEEHELEIVLVDGRVLRGTARFVLPAGRTRLLDFLNDEQPFIRLAEQAMVALINKRHIARVTKTK